MAAKGTEAKNIITEKISELFGANFVGVYDKKIYVNVKESSGELIQIALSMTCPKNPIGATFNETNPEIMNSIPEASSMSTGDEIRPEEAQTVKALMEKLGL